MNTQHLQYIIEIERTRSISQAAENLFLGQPNLSRILHDLEESLGFRIFERTSRGVRPTERGARFLKHARNMLREMDYIEALGPRHAVPNRLRVCIPRSAKLLDATAGYLASLPEASDLDARIFECHARGALEILSAGEDSLRNDTEAFALRLIKAGICVTAQRIPEAMHGFTTNRTPGWERALEAHCKFFRQHL